MISNRLVAGPLAAALLLAASASSAAVITVTLTGNTENVHDNANVFGQGAGTLTNLSFVETLLINTAGGVDSSGGYSSNGPTNPAVSATIAFNGGPAFSVAGLNYSGAHATAGTVNPFTGLANNDFSLLTDDSVGLRLDNSVYVDLYGTGIPTSFAPITLALSPGEVSNVSFTDEVSGGALPDAIGNLFPTLLTISTDAAGAVPEPASWATMIAGFALVGGAMRRRAARFACA